MTTLIQCPWPAGSWNSLRLSWVQIVTLVPESGLDPESSDANHMCVMTMLYSLYIQKDLFVDICSLVNDSSFQNDVLLPIKSLLDKVPGDTAPIAQVFLASARAFFPTRAWSPTSPAPIPVSLLSVAETPAAVLSSLLSPPEYWTWWSF